jgi:hypothetical protein
MTSLQLDVGIMTRLDLIEIQTRKRRHELSHDGADRNSSVIEMSETLHRHDNQTGTGNSSSPFVGLNWGLGGWLSMPPDLSILCFGFCTPTRRSETSQPSMAVAIRTRTVQIHLAVYAHGLSMRMFHTEGARTYWAEAGLLIDRFKMDYLLANKMATTAAPS